MTVDVNEFHRLKNKRSIKQPMVDVNIQLLDNRYCLSSLCWKLNVSVSKAWSYLGLECSTSWSGLCPKL